MALALSRQPADRGAEFEAQGDLLIDGMPPAHAAYLEGTFFTPEFPRKIAR
jgi:hypothetical protein